MRIASSRSRRDFSYFFRLAKQGRARQDAEEGGSSIITCIAQAVGSLVELAVGIVHYPPALAPHRPMDK